MEAKQCNVVFVAKLFGVSQASEERLSPFFEAD